MSGFGFNFGFNKGSGGKAGSPGDELDAELSTVYTSRAFYPGVGAAVTVVDGTYQKNGAGGFVSAATTSLINDYFELRGTSSGLHETDVTPTLIVDGVNFIFTITTLSDTIVFDNLTESAFDNLTEADFGGAI